MHAYMLEEEKRMSSFDTLKFAKRAEKAGFTKQQAEFQAEEIAKVLEDNLITKDDLKLSSDDVKCLGIELEKTKVELKNDIEKIHLDVEKAKVELRSDVEMLRVEVKSIENKIVMKLGAMMVVAVGVLATVIKIF